MHLHNHVHHPQPHPTQISKQMENEPYEVSNLQLKTTISHPQQSQRRTYNEAAKWDTQVRQRLQKQIQHTTPMQRSVITVAPQVNGTQSSIALVTQGDSLSNLKESHDQYHQGTIMQEQAGVACSQQFITRGNCP